VWVVWVLQAAAGALVNAVRAPVGFGQQQQRHSSVTSLSRKALAKEAVRVMWVTCMSCGLCERHRQKSV
jgi:hypothetical protein